MSEVRVLVVEDEVIVAKNIESRLRGLGYTVPAIALTGEEAIEIAASVHPDLVLMDIRLPGRMDGIEAAAEIRARFDTPVVYLTASASTEALDRVKATQPFGYVFKPFEVKELDLAIKMALYKHELDRKVRESEARYRAISEVISDFAYALRVEPDGTLKLEWATGALARISGYTPEEIRERGNWESLIYPEDLSVIQRHFGANVAGRPEVGDVRIIHRDGSVRWLRHYSRPVQDGDEGRVVRIIAAAQDVTTQRQMEAERERLLATLEQRTVQLQTAAEVSRAANSTLDLDDLIQQAVDLARARFDLYYAGLFLVEDDPAGEEESPAGARWAVLRAGTGEAGQRMLEEGHRLEVGGDSMVGWCTANSQARIALDVGREAVRFDNPALPDTRSEMALPLISRGHAIGALSIQSTQESAFSEEDVAVLQTMADQLANAITNARLYERARQEIAERERAENALRQRVHKQTALYSVASAAATSLSPDALLSTTLDVVIRILDADAGWVALPGAGPDSPPSVVTWRDVPASLITAEENSPLHDCPFCTTTFERNVALLPERLCFFDCRRLPRQVLSDVNLHSHIGIPLSVGDRVLGVLTVAWRAPSFTPVDWPLLTAIGQQVGLALNNAQLYEQARQVNRLRILNDLDRALAATLDLETIAEVTLHEITDGLDVPKSALFLLSPSESATALQLFTTRRGWTLVSMSEEDGPLVKDFLSSPLDAREILHNAGQGAAGSCRELARRWGLDGIAIPILKDENLVVGLTLGGRPAERPFTEEDGALIQAAAGRIAQAIQNARLYRASEERAARLASLNAITTAAGSSLDVDAALRQVLDLVCQALNALEGFILLRVPEEDGLFLALSSSGTNHDTDTLYLAPGEDLAGWAVQQARAAYVNDTSADPRCCGRVETFTGSGARSLACAPLTYHGKITGAIQVAGKLDGEFGDEDLRLLEAVAPVVAAALENASLYTATRERAVELALLNEISLALTSMLDADAVVSAALHHLASLFRADGVSLLEPDPATGELSFAHALFRSERIEIPIRLSPGEGIAGWVLEHHESVVVDDAQTDPRFCNQVDRHLECQTRAMLVALLQTQERPVGIIEVISNEPGFFTQNDLRTLRAIASTLTVALDNAHLYERLRTLLREREQAQARLVRAEKMAALGRLVVSLAHEINNPLQALRSGLGLLLSHRGDEEKQQRYLEIASGEVERLIAIVERVLGFHRPSSDHVIPIDVNTAVEETLLLVGKTMEQSKVTLRCELAAGLPPVRATADQLRQVFLNLIFNALQAMPMGGELAVVTASKHQDAEVTVSFTDTGEGMSDDQMQHVFEPFHTTRPEGTGLGLTISYGIVERHGGRIEVMSQVDEGSSFIIVLPALREGMEPARSEK